MGETVNIMRLVNPHRDQEPLWFGRPETKKRKEMMLQGKKKKRNSQKPDVSLAFMCTDEFFER